MTDLQTVLELATDEIRSPDLARTAVAAARRRRVRRRGLGGAAVAAALVTGVAVAPHLVDRGDDPVHEPIRRPSSAPTPTGAATTTPTGAPTPSGPSSADVQPEWDPRKVDALPAAPRGLAPALPDIVDPPSSAEALADSPVTSAVLSVRGESALMLLARDGSWRSVPLPAGEPSFVELTRDGTRLLLQTTEGVDVWDLPTGTVQSLPRPEGYEPSLSPSWSWVDDSTLLLDDAAGGWLVDAETGAAERVPYPEAGKYWWAIDPEGWLVESADFVDPAVLTDWKDGEPRSLDMRPIGRLASLVADSEVIVGTTYENGPFSVVVAGRADLSPRAVLPLADPEANYSNGGLQVAALLDDGTVLLQVTVFLGGGHFSWRLVAWDPGSGALSLLTRGSQDTPVVTSLAVDDLG